MSLHPEPNDIPLLLMDSGAFSAWNQKITINLDQYIEFCLAHLRHFDYIVNLDVIPAEFGRKPTAQEAEQAAREGWKNYEYMLSKGIPQEKLIHVFHQGEDFKWLKKMAELPYIGLSPANDRSTEQKITWLDSCMPYITDEKGTPLNKWHGFAVTSLRLMMRYPWYSVDSATWGFVAAMGAIFIPVFEKNTFQYFKQPIHLFFSNRNPKMKVKGKHFSTLSIQEKNIIQNYLSQIQIPLGESVLRQEKQGYVLKSDEKWHDKKSCIVDHILTPGVINTTGFRQQANIQYFCSLQKHLSERPQIFKHRKKGFAL